MKKLEEGGAFSLFDPCNLGNPHFLTRIARITLIRGPMALEFEKETYAIIGAAMEVHSILGPGYLEAVYHEAMEIEFHLREIAFISEPRLEIPFKGRILTQYYVPDFIVFETIPLELKAHSAPLTNADGKQIVNSLQCSGKTVGLLINFGRPSLDWRRYVSTPWK